jgi:hypothetical protein
MSSVQHDAAVVRLPDGREYVLVLLANDFGANEEGRRKVVEAGAQDVPRHLGGDDRAVKTGPVSVSWRGPSRGGSLQARLRGERLVSGRTRVRSGAVSGDTLIV